MKHESVDLGLPSGLFWATCNIGANSPEECGDCFAWGEIKPKDEYTEENSLTHNKNIASSFKQQFIAHSSKQDRKYRLLP